MRAYKLAVLVALSLEIDALHAGALARKQAKPADASTKSISGSWQIPGGALVSEVKVQQIRNIFSFEITIVNEVAPLVNVGSDYVGEGLIDGDRISMTYSNKSESGKTDAGKCAGNFETTNKISWNCEDLEGKPFNYSWIRQQDHNRLR
jgi:hypothetical protein